MSTNFPTALDDFTNYVDGTTIMESATLNDMQFAIEALEAKVGIDSSAVTTSHDYILSHDGLIDRGDPSAFDWTISTLTADGAWHDLDCSSIVPAGAQAILFLAQIYAGAKHKNLRIRKKGNSNDRNASIVNTQAASTYNIQDLRSFCDSNRKCEYKIDSGVTQCDIVIKGWWK